MIRTQSTLNVQLLANCVVSKDGQFWFYLDRELVEVGLKCCQQNQTLLFSDSLLTQLRQAVVWDTGGLSEPDSSFNVQSGLTFCTHFEDRLVLRTVMSMDGDVLNQIDRQLLHTSDDCLKLNQVHHWLLTQLTDKLCGDFRRFINKFTDWLAFLVCCLSSVLAFNYFKSWYVLGVTMPLGILIRHLSRQSLRRSLPILLRFGFSHVLSPNPIIQWLSQQVLARLA